MAAALPATPPRYGEDVWARCNESVEGSGAAAGLSPSGRWSGNHVRRCRSRGSKLEMKCGAISAASDLICGPSRHAGGVSNVWSWTEGRGLVVGGGERREPVCRWVGSFPAGVEEGHQRSGGGGASLSSLPPSPSLLLSFLSSLPFFIPSIICLPFPQ